MKPTATSMDVSLEPIIYFYTHSLLIIGVAAVVFMALGIWIGHLTWAKFKRRARAYHEECDLLRHEIAALKRRIGEAQAGTAPLVLINEDAPVPEESDSGPELPGFLLPSSTELPPAPILLPSPEPAPEPVVAKAPPPAPEPARESLASVVIGAAGTAHHTLEPIATPDSITEIAPSVPATNGTHPPSSEEAKKDEPVKPAELPVVAAAEPEAVKPEPAKPERKTQKTKLPAAKHEPAPKHEPSPTPEPPPPPAIEAKAAFATELGQGIAVEDPTLGILLHAQPDRWDDLTLLRGVGEVLQQRLHDNGVHTFKQIAYWTETNVVAFSNKIEARDRIHRDHWVAQARDMHFLKYGEKLG